MFALCFGASIRSNSYGVISVESVLEFFAALIGLGLLALFVVLPIIALVRARAARKLAKRNKENW